MSPWEFRIGQTVSYRPRGKKWRAKITAVERDGRPFLAEIPVVDEHGTPVLYEEPPGSVNLVTDFENYDLVDQSENAADPWLAARLDHDDDGGVGRKKLAERLGTRPSFNEAIGAILEKWAPSRKRELLDDLLVLLHATWWSGRQRENGECARLLIDRCAANGVICCAHCTHYEDAAAVRSRMKEA
jgi:hypothetical protein